VLRDLAAGLIDYAGLFPPAGLTMRSAVRNYATYRRSPQAWMLGRFIVPASRLPEFIDESSALPADLGGTLWRLSVLLAEGDEHVETLRRFNAQHGLHGGGRWSVEAVEIGAAEPGAISEWVRRLERELTLFFEVPLPEAGNEDDEGVLLARLDAIRDTGTFAKIRTGGVTAGAIPAVRAIARFLGHAAVRDVAFKATAGLHHAIRGDHALTYEPGAPVATMHGLLNLVVAAVLARERAADTDKEGVEKTIETILQEREPGAFGLDDRRLAWRDVAFDGDRIAAARARFVLGVGSCSFEEPIADLRALGLLATI